MEAANQYGVQIGDDIYRGIQNRIQLLSEVGNLYVRFKNIVEREGEGLSEYQIFNIRNCLLTFVVHII